MRIYGDDTCMILLRCVECENTYGIIEVRRVREYIYMARACF